MTGRIEANPGTRRELVQALIEWALATRGAEGVETHLYEDLECAHIFSFVSHWPDLGALERHVSGPQFGGLVGAVELLAASSAVTMASGEAGFGFREFRRRALAAQPRAGGAR